MKTIRKTKQEFTGEPMKRAVLLTALMCVPSITPKVIKTTLTSEEKNLLATSGSIQEVTSLMQRRYYKALTPETCDQALEDALQAYVHRDPHSGYLSKKELSKLTSMISGEFYGIGVVLPGDKEIEEDAVPFIEIIPEGPADKAGLKAGDKLIQIDDQIIKGMKMDDVMSKIKGERNTKVRVRIMREKYPDALDIEVTRDIIKDEVSLSFYLPEQNVCYLFLPVFGEKSAKHVEALLKTAQQKKSRAVIIDLRNNTGGLFESAISIASLFVPKNTTVVVTKNRENKITQTWKTEKKPLGGIETLPVFFLVNNYTASAAEILSGTLRIYAEHHNNLSIFIVGTQTFGKGSVQDVIPLQSGGALRLTTSLYFLPHDTCIQGKGIEPDFIIEDRQLPSDTVKWMTDHYGRESVLKGSIKPHENNEKNKKKSEKKQGNKKEEKPWKEKRKEWLANNYLFQTTLNLVNLLDQAKRTQPKMSFISQRAFLKQNYVIDRPVMLQEL